MMASLDGRQPCLFELPRIQKQLDQVRRLESFGRCSRSAELRRLVRSPVISAEDQARALNVLLEKAKSGGLTVNFFKLIARNRRLFAAGDMIKGFRALLARERGEVNADVTSAHPLTSDQMKCCGQTAAQVGKNVNIATASIPIRWAASS